MPRTGITAWFFRCENRSGQILPAIGGQCGAGNEAGIIRGKESHAARDLFGFAQPADRDGLYDLLALFY